MILRGGPPKRLGRVSQRGGKSSSATSSSSSSNGGKNGVQDTNSDMPPSKKRSSEPDGWNPLGTGVIPRRGTDPLQYFTSDQLRNLVLTNPLRVIADLPYLHPAVDMALNTALRLTCTEDGLTIFAEDGTTDAEGAAVPNPEDTASLDAMWARLPAEVGGSLRGLRTMLMQYGILTGQAIVEAIPGPPLQGISRVLPIDPLTTGFNRKDRESDLTLRQWQRFPTNPQATQSPGIGQSQWSYNWVEMPMERVKWRSFDPDMKNPHGKSFYTTALNEVLADLAMMQDLRDAVHNAAWPRTKIGVNLTELHKVAVEVYRIGDPKRAAEWVTTRFNDIVEYASNLGPEENVVCDSSGTVETLQAGSFTGLEGVLSFLRQRIAQSLKTLPTLLGINDGSTFNYTSVEWAIYAQSLETVACVVDDVLIDISNLHLRLIGSKSIARAKRTGIRTNDNQVDANTLSTTITNATNLEKLGHITHDQGSMMTVNRQAAGPAQPGVIEPLPTEPGPTAATQTQGTRKDKPGPRNLPPGSNSTGTTQEDRNAKKNRPNSAFFDAWTDIVEKAEEWTLQVRSWLQQPWN